MLKSDHALTRGYAKLVAHTALGSDAGSADDAGSLIDEQYSGKKAGMRPVDKELSGWLKKAYEQAG